MSIQNWYERQRNVLAQEKPATLSKDATQFIQGVYPTHLVSGHGCYVRDTEGKEYIDFICGLGAISLGYSNQRIAQAIKNQVDNGFSFSLPHILEIEVAEMIQSYFPDMEKVRFMKNGDDVTRAAVRIARSFTGRKMVLSNGYHGHSDFWTSLTGPAKGVHDCLHVYSLNDDYVYDFENDFPPHMVAAVIVEAAKLELSTSYKEKLFAIRDLCRKNGIVFIMDEIVTNCRVPRWTVSEMWHLKPDLICLGKGIANGAPLAVIGGRRDLMDCDYFVSTTHGGEALSLAACKATLHELYKRNFEDLLFYGQRLMSRLNELHPLIQWQGYGTRAQLNTDTLEAQLFMQEMCKAGFLFGKAFFFNFAHLERNVEELTLSVARSVIDRIKSGNLRLEGKPPKMAFKR